jgi:ribonuclease R
MTKKKKKNENVGYKKQFTGILDVSRSGMGFVIVDGLEKDIKIKPNNFNKAFNGDEVVVDVEKYQVGSTRVEGVITKVVKRKQDVFVGTIEVKEEFAFFTPDSNAMLPDFFVPIAQLNAAQHGNRVLVKLVKWGPKDRKPEGKVMEVITAARENDFAMQDILQDAGFTIGFNDVIVHETAQLSAVITKADLKARKDFRDVLTFTIDPVDAKDFDDAISIKYLAKGNIEIGVHIADVSHFVKPNTALDDEAYARATSVYLPDRVNPMLPEKISNELCSLRPHEDKFTFSAVFELTPNGKIEKTWIGRTLIHSNHRFTYEEVQEIIESKNGLHVTEILLLDKIAKQFRNERFKKGAINFNSVEVRFKLDENGAPVGIVLKESKDAHKLIEEFMLLANRAVAEYISKIKVKEEPVPAPYRVHDTPDEEKLAPFAAFARKFGYEFDVKNKNTIARSFNNLLAAVAGKPEQTVLEQLGIRTMAKAVYTTNNIGHYGLGFEHYAHFTSPIRRYPDVLLHRALQECLDGKPVLDDTMEKKCTHCSERERKAMEAERAGNKYKQVEYMQQFIGDEFEGVISGVTNFGIFVETVAHKCEGLVSLKDLLLIDDFVLVETDYSLLGRRTKKQFRMGDTINVKVISANLAKRQLDFEWVNK